MTGLISVVTVRRVQLSLVKIMPLVMQNWVALMVQRLILCSCTHILNTLLTDLRLPPRLT